jgi:hypothetical protein
MRASPGGLGRSRAAKLAAVAVLLLAVVAGCAEPQPWVKPYEREPVNSTYLEHVYESREGARGATGTIGGGCGCN